MKTKPVFYILVAASAALVLAGTLVVASCFSPWSGDSGNLTLVWGNTEGRWAIQSDLETFDYIVTLRGPGGTIEERFKAGVSSANFDVIPGIWNVTIKGYEIPAVGVLSGYELAVMGIEQVEIKPNKKSTKDFPMYNAVEVKNWDNISTSIASPPTGPLMFLIANDLKADTSPSGGYAPVLLHDCIFVAEKDVTIGRANADNQQGFFEITGNVIVNLGIPGMAGTITFDNEGVSLTSVGLMVLLHSNNSKLVMNDGITIKGGSFSSTVAAAVYIPVECAGAKESFIMNGGTITGNHVHGSLPKGGGVFKAATGDFDWNGGTITGNTPENVHRE